MYVIMRPEKNLWTVGCVIPPTHSGPQHTWCPLKDFGSAEEAMRLIHYLNGGNAMEFTPR